MAGPRAIAPATPSAAAASGCSTSSRLPTASARAGGDLALHVLEVMTALLDSAAEGRRIDLTTTIERPALVPLTLPAR